MELLRQLEINNYKTWDKMVPRSETMREEKDCDPCLLNGWADKDLSLWDVSTEEKKPGLKRILVLRLIQTA
jgi:hypothetical protein